MTTISTFVRPKLVRSYLENFQNSITLYTGEGRRAVSHTAPGRFPVKVQRRTSRRIYVASENEYVYFFRKFANSESFYRLKRNDPMGLFTPMSPL